MCTYNFLFEGELVPMELARVRQRCQRFGPVQPEDPAFASSEQGPKCCGCDGPLPVTHSWSTIPTGPWGLDVPQTVHLETDGA